MRDNNRRTLGRTPGYGMGNATYQPKKLRVICDGVEERFPTEEEAEDYADQLRQQGKRPIHCSF